LPEGSAFSAEKIADAIERGVKVRPVQQRVSYFGFVDMSGGSNDDACLGIAHRENGRAVLDLCINQGTYPPFDPMKAVTSFADVLKEYRLSRVTGDRYAGETFKAAFLKEGITYQVSELTKHEIYEAVEVLFNTGTAVLLDSEAMESQFLGLVWRGSRIDHLPGEHDDFCNAAAGVLHLASKNVAFHQGFPIGVGRSIFAGNADAMVRPLYGGGGRLSVGIPVAGNPGRYQRDDDD
jgi:hypothetical protein